MAQARVGDIKDEKPKAANPKKTELPACPISLEPVTDLQDPVVCRDGRIYERKELEQIVKGQPVPSPVNPNLKLTTNDLFKSNDLNYLIQCYKELQAELAKEKQKYQELQQQLELHKLLPPLQPPADSKMQLTSLKTDSKIDESVSIVSRSNQRIAELEQSQKQVIAEKIALELMYGYKAKKVKKKLTALRDSIKATRKQFHQQLEQHKKNMLALTEAFKPEEEIELVEKKSQTITERMTWTALAWDETSKQYQAAKNNHKREFAELMFQEKKRFANVLPAWLQHKKSLAANAGQLKLLRGAQVAELNKIQQHAQTTIDSTVSIFGGTQKTKNPRLQKKAEQKIQADVKIEKEKKELTAQLHDAIADKFNPKRSEQIRELILKGADVNEREVKSNLEPVFLAVGQQDKGLLELLVQSRANVNVRSQLLLGKAQRSMNTPLLLLMASLGKCGCHNDSCNECVREQELVDIMLKAPGVDVNAQDSTRDSILNWAVYHHKVKITENLLRNGADPRLKDKDGRDAKYWAEKGTTLKETQLTNLLQQAVQPSAPALSPRHR